MSFLNIDVKLFCDNIKTGFHIRQISKANPSTHTLFVIIVDDNNFGNLISLDNREHSLRQKYFFMYSTILCPHANTQCARYGAQLIQAPLSRRGIVGRRKTRSREWEWVATCHVTQGTANF